MSIAQRVQLPSKWYLTPFRFSGGAEQHIISAGEIVGLDRDAPHSLEALEESALILVTAIT
jgi:quercetin dioxygenase-like cupin family protein